MLIGFNKISVVALSKSFHSIAKESPFRTLQFCSKDKFSSIQNCSRRHMTRQSAEQALQRHNPRDVTFEVPYGYLAGQEWGNPEAENKILCTHGYLDNCASFQPMLPYFLNHKDNAVKYHVVAFDSSGVGLSSHRPAGTEYNQMGHIIDVKRVVDHLKWTSFHIIGHSMGANYCFFYSCLFPEEVRSLVTIDLPCPFYRPTQNWNTLVAKSIKEQLIFEKQIDNNPTTNCKIAILSREEAIQKLIDSHALSLNRESAEIMLSRGAKKESWGYTFNRDLRLRNRLVEMHQNENFLLDLLTNTFKTKLFTILAKESYLYPRAITKDKITKMFDLYSKQCPVFKSVWLSGTHHLHMNDPQSVASLVAEFYDSLEDGNKIDSKL